MNLLFPSLAQLLIEFLPMIALDSLKLALSFQDLAHQPATNRHEDCNQSCKYWPPGWIRSACVHVISVTTRLPSPWSTPWSSVCTQ